MRTLALLPLCALIIPGAFAQSTCGNVQLQLTPNYSFAVGSSSGGSAYTFAIGNQTLAQGLMTQLALLPFEKSLASTSGFAPAQAIGTSLVPGKFGSAVTIAAGGTLAYPEQGNLSFGDGTVEMWVSPQYAGSNPLYNTNSQQVFFIYWGGKGNQLVLAISNNGNAGPYVYAGAQGVYAGSAQVSGITAWNAGEWHHLASTYSSSNGRVRLYVDGVLAQETDSAVQFPGGGPSTFTIGSDGAGHSSNFAIDELRISNDEMAAGAIAYDASRSTPFANNEVYLSLSGVSPGQLMYSVQACGSATDTYGGMPMPGPYPPSTLPIPVTPGQGPAPSGRGGGRGWRPLGPQIIVRTAADLNGVSSNMAANYVLATDIDLSGISDFSPIGLSGSQSATTPPVPFTGTFDGAGHAINGLTQVSAGQYAGLFGLIGSGGSIKNLRLENALITSNYIGGSASTGNPIPGMIGILAGENDQGTIVNVTLNGAMVSTNSGSACGGLVGVNIGTIANSSASVTLTATLSDSDTGLLDQSTQIGGIAGRNNGAITNVSATGTISVELNAVISARAIFGAQIGGLIGLSDSAGVLAGSNSSVNISGAFSGSVHATSADHPYTAYWNAIGGLVGNAPSTSTIVDSFSRGTITVTDGVQPGLANYTVGGLLGSGGTIWPANNGLEPNGAIDNVNPAGTPTVTRSSASGPIKATGLTDLGASLSVGGLVGVFNGTVVSSYASGSVDVTGQGYNGVGGLVGQIWSGALTDVNTSSSVTSVNTGIGSDVGGLAGTSGAAVSNAIASGIIVSNVTIAVPIGGNGFTKIDSTVGGLVGFNHGVIKTATALGAVTATFAGSVVGSGSSYNDQAAGLVANSAGPISNSSAWGAVSLTSTITTSDGGTSTQIAGGLVGGGYIGFGSVSAVTNSLSTGAVSASGINDVLMVGALMGYNSGSIASSYALGKPSVQGGGGNAIGGLVGRNDTEGAITSSYWDAPQAGLTIGIGSGTATGATSWAAAPPTIPAGFDPMVWGTATTVNNGYPCLLWQAACGSPGLLSDSDRIFNFMQAKWPQYFGVTSPTSETALGYYYRYYNVSGFYLAMQSGELYLGWLRPNSRLLELGIDVVDLGTVASWRAMAEAAGF